MSKLVFPYFEAVAKTPKGKIIKIFRPIIPVRLCWKHQLTKTLINALVDSGADRNLFPAVIGELMLGIKIEKGKKIIHSGIGGIKIEAFVHPVKIYLKGCCFTTEVDFSYHQEIPILGRSGFFRHFQKVIFKEIKKELILVY